MADLTQSLKLEKPLLTENYDVEVQNRNMDIIDNKISILESEFTTHQAETAKQTIKDITYYVSNTGDDYNNNGLTAETAFKTIQYAINSLPQIVNHVVTINIADNDYNEDINLSGFIGSGSIQLVGGNDLVSAIKTSSIEIINCTLLLKIIGITCTTTSNIGFSVIASSNVEFEHCSITTSSSSAGFYAKASHMTTWKCQASNRKWGLWAQQMSIVYSTTWIDSLDNERGLYAEQASIIGKNSTQPTGTITNELECTGGKIF